MRKKLFKSIAGFLLIALIISSCQQSKEDKKEIPKEGPKPALPVDAIIVKTKSISEQIEVPGSIIPFEETALQPEVAGRVVAINFKEGANVVNGNLLVKLYDADLQAQINKLRVQLLIAKKTEERQKDLLQINGISQQEYDLSLLSVNNIQADINILKTSIDKTEIKAPYNGKAGLRNISIGAYITPQTIITNIRQTNQLKLEFAVPEKYSADIRLGGKAHFMIDGSNKTFPASVIATENNISENTRSLKVKALINSSDKELVAGAFAKVQIMLRENIQALMIPSQAIIPQARNKKVIACRNGLASMEIVTTGYRDSSMVEITTGLKAGDTVLITGLLSTKPGSKVKIKPIN